MQKDYWPFVLLVFATVLSLTVFRSPVERAGDESAAAGSSGAPAGESAPASPSSSGPFRPVNRNDTPLTEREAKEVHIRLSPDACNPLVRKTNELSGIGVNDKRKLLATVACLRKGNLAWAKCVERASTRDDLASCSRRLLIE
ncbi:MAG TPA: hypothetical protein VGG39_13240 [Polyangiaceae bacterium]